MSPQIKHQPLIIKKAEKSDMPSIAQIVKSSAEWYRPFVDEKDMQEHDVNKDWQERNFRQREFWVGKNDRGQSIGTVSLQYFGDTAYLGYVYLHAEHTGKGYGKILLNHAKKTAREKGSKKLILIAHPKAQWAVKAYLRYGFEVMAKKKQDVLSFKDGLLKPYYEEGFHLFGLPLVSHES